MIIRFLFNLFFLLSEIKRLPLQFVWRIILDDESQKIGILQTYKHTIK